MIPNELREIDFSIGLCAGLIEIKGYEKGNRGHYQKYFRWNLYCYLIFIKQMIVAHSLLETEKKLTIDFYPKLFHYRLSLPTNSCVKIITEQITLFSSAEDTTVCEYAKSGCD